MKKTAIILCLLILLNAVSCTVGDRSDTTETMSSQPQVTTGTAEADISVPLKIAKTEVITLAELPYDSESAQLTGAPVGGSPRFYKFTDGLTYYVSDKYAKVISQCTLALPDGFEGGNIVFISGGAGSGELFIGVETVYGGETVYLDYYFFSGESVSDPLSVYMHDERAVPYLDRLNG